MKEHTITLTINVHFNAIDREDAQRIAEDMDIKFIHPDTKTEIENDLIDWEIRQSLLVPPRNGGGRRMDLGFRLDILINGSAAMRE